MARSTSTRRTTARRSTRTTRRTVSGTRTRTSVPKTSTRVRSAKRSLKYFTFQYNRDDVSHAANANNVTIVDRLNNGTSVSLSLQEAKSLYEFLGSQIRSR